MKFTDADPFKADERGLNNGIRALVFDFDGLLMDTENCRFQSWAYLLTSLGASLFHREVADLVGQQGQATFLFDRFRSASGLDISNAEIERLVLKEAYKRIENISPMDGVIDYLTSAKQMGLKLAIATSSEQEHYLPLLTRTGLLDYFDCITGSDDVGEERVKPNPDVYNATLDKLGVYPGEAIAFEDSPPGVTAAKNAGIRCVAVPNQITRYLKFCHADLVLPSMAQLPLIEVISQLTSRE